jgi:3-O-methylgallate 3,4-dioxygenase
MSHFTINQELDRSVMEAFLACDGDKLGAIPRVQLNSGNSEIRNWIVVAGASIGLSPQWHDYIPCYRTPAGTGCGMGFAILGNGQ